MKKPFVYIAADHRGHDLIERMADHVIAHEREVCYLKRELEPGDDYPLIAQRLLGSIADGKIEAILACGSGAGMAIAANRFQGIRAVVGMSAAHVAAARNDDDANVLVLAADFVSDDDAKAMVDAFLMTPFSGDERHVRRIKELDELVA